MVSRGAGKELDGAHRRPQTSDPDLYIAHHTDKRIREAVSKMSQRYPPQ